MVLLSKESSQRTGRNFLCPLDARLLFFSRPSRLCFDGDTSTGAEIDANHWLGTAVGGGCIGAFNDTHTHAEVMAAFDRAIELAEAGQ